MQCSVSTKKEHNSVDVCAFQYLNDLHGADGIEVGVKVVIRSHRNTHDILVWASGRNTAICFDIT